MSDPNGGGFGPPGGAPPPGGGGFGPPGGAPPQGGGFGSPPQGGGFGSPPQGGGFGSPPQGAPPAGGGFGAPPPGGGFGAAPGTPQMQQMPGVEINIMPAFIMGIFTTTVCGCLPLGLGALYMADQAKKAGFRGDEAGARSKLMISYGLSAFSFVGAFIAIALYMMLVIAAEM